jgi:ketosteroid isomerase-like protein
MTIQQTPNVPCAVWRAIINRDSLEAFASAFVRDPVLVASVANAAVYGAAAIRTFFKASAGIYETIAFTTEATLGQRTFLEWKGSALGEKSARSTVPVPLAEHRA